MIFVGVFLNDRVAGFVALRKSLQKSRLEEIDQIFHSSVGPLLIDPGLAWLIDKVPAVVRD